MTGNILYYITVKQSLAERWLDEKSCKAEKSEMNAEINPVGFSSSLDLFIAFNNRH